MESHGVHIALPGDRRDEDLIGALDMTRSYVDYYVFYDPDPRNRRPNEVPDLLEHHLAGTVPSEIASCKHDASSRARAATRLGDRLIVIVDLGDDVPALLQNLAGSAAEDARCDEAIAARGGRSAAEDVAG